jgi:hypothetical protein
MRYLEGNTGSISFSTPVTIGDSVYTGPLLWELADDQGAFINVDPIQGADNLAVHVDIDPSNPQVLLLTKLADAIPFRIRATYPGAAGPCSQPSVQAHFIWSAPDVWLNPFCVTAAQ